MPFERARTQLALGERLRRAKQRAEAREPLTAALDEFERLGARPWAERARTELRATGGPAAGRRAPAAADQLTPHELQIAVLVAQGMTNREAAAALFLSPKTIEYHLGQIYRKLDVRGRAQLARSWRWSSPTASATPRSSPTPCQRGTVPHKRRRPTALRRGTGGPAALAWGSFQRGTVPLYLGVEGLVLGDDDLEQERRGAVATARRRARRAARRGC